MARSILEIIDMNGGVIVIESGTVLRAMLITGALADAMSAAGDDVDVGAAI